jgi:hypothetical protein
VIPRPVVQGHQRIQPAAIHELQLREIQHYDPGVLLRDYRIPQSADFRTAHQTSRAVHHSYIATFLDIDRKHD